MTKAPRVIMIGSKTPKMGTITWSESITMLFFPFDAKEHKSGYTLTKNSDPFFCFAICNFRIKPGVKGL